MNLLKRILANNREPWNGSDDAPLQRVLGHQPHGILSICSANEEVIKAAIFFSNQRNLPILIESTCNQVNQEGGYTGLTPFEFREKIKSLEADQDLNHELVVLGGDHLGPFPWRDRPAKEAMMKACELVAECVRAGYSKLHLDASMPCGDDEEESLNRQLIAERTAMLAAAAEDAFTNLPPPGAVSRDEPLYVIGTDVPPPGGQTNSYENVWVTSTENARETYDFSKQAFWQHGLADAWKRVIAQVVQPGVDFGNHYVSVYDRAAASHLKEWIETIPSVVFEVHSTDYQPGEALASLVADHFAILKVGPALTFAYREAIFSLAAIEEELITGTIRKPSGIRQVLEEVMLQNPEHWKDYYTGTDIETRLMRKYSLSDRSRYYWNHPDLRAALVILFENLSDLVIPTGMVSQYFPRQFYRTRNQSIPADPHVLVTDAIQCVLEDYAWACSNRREVI